jgi:hypothetical protein
MSRMLRLLAALVFVGGFANYAAAGEGQLNQQAEPKHRQQVNIFWGVHDERRYDARGPKHPSAVWSG